MKKHTILFILLFLCFNTKAQIHLLDKKINLNLSETPIESALDSIEQKAQCYFTYNADLFKDRKPLNITIKNEKLSSVLRKLIPDKDLNFHVTKKHIVIVPVKEALNVQAPKEIIPYISYRKLTGIVKDLNSKEALPYASIGIRGKHVGTITNQDGEFSLSISSENLNDTLVFSYVGYQNNEIVVANLKKNQIEVELKEDFISLQEVIIRNNDPLALVHAAVNNIHKNYPQKSTNLTSFYRESVMKNNKYMIYLESVLDIYKSSYSHQDALERVKVFKSRKIYDVTRLDTISFRLKGGIQGCLQLDIVKNLPEFLNEEYTHLYNYRLLDISTYNNRSVYIIEFKPRPKLSEPMLEGKLFIETNNLAIIRAEFGFEKYRMNELKNRFIVKGSAKTKAKPSMINYVVSYRDINGKYYLNHALGNLKFKVKNKKRLFSSYFFTSFEMATTNVKAENVVRFKYRESLPPTTIFSNYKTRYDPTFWGKSNFIKPEENIQDALKRINNSMQQIALGRSDLN
ncbi:carboxypeptidase-like regulatory domain-containing protein [Marinifilum sp. D737]|uniref:carboxypeptidase-like regulatory domain-containing protein n=1 Tax=Marinifilum sp. D737 TaxID=2969628 RepID=UPI0022731835|nr:carboxypeptidase-like regulatory domain-containing protein [Marinifilum sp. D737]MCY1636171.1 carboxypeptidase-like regulatory domain-containing protein [Marinifilum sp. D737]